MKKDLIKVIGAPMGGADKDTQEKLADLESRVVTAEQIKEAFDNLPDGQAVSAQVAENTGKLSELETKVGFQKIDITYTGRYINTGVGIGNVAPINQPTTSENWRCMVKDCEEGDTIVVNGKGGSSARLWAFVNVNNVILDVSSGTEEGIELELIAPAGAAKVVINDNINSEKTSYYLSKDSLESRKAGKEEVVNCNVTIENIKNLLGSNLVPEIPDYEWSQYGITINGKVGTSTNYVHSTPISVNKGDIVVLNQPGSVPANYVRVAKVVDSEYIPAILTYVGYTNFIFIADEDMYISITANKAQPKELYIYRSKLVKELTEYNAISERKSAYLESSVSNKKGLCMPVDWDGLKIDATGMMSYDSDRKTTDFISTYNIACLRCKAVDGITTVYLHKYDIDKNWLSMETFNGSFDYDFNCAAVEYERPKIYYIRLSVKTTIDNPLSVYIDGANSKFNPRLLSNVNVKCLSHQGVGVKMNSNGTALATGSNTLSAVWGAYLNGYDVILVNQQFSLDGVCYCNHDGYFKDSVTGETIYIEQHTSNEMNNYRYNSEPICKLESVMYLAKMLGMGVWLVNAGASYRKESEMTEIIRIVKKYQMWDNSYIMTSIQNAQKYLAECPYATIAICQENVSSTDLSEISNLYNGIINSGIKTEQNKVFAWISGKHSEENLIWAAENCPTGVRIGAFNVPNENVMNVVPYVNVYSVPSIGKSYGQSRRDFELEVAAKYPEILSGVYGTIV